PSSTQWFGGCFGFRAGPAAAGSLLVLVTYFIGLRLFRRRGVAAVGAFFVAIDGLALTMSRIAMLDIFLALFVALGVWFLLIDRDEMWRDLPPPPTHRIPRVPHRSHRWRWVAGLAFGLAFATKWSAVLAIGGAGIFVAASEMLWRHRVTGSPWTALWRPAINTVLTLIALPAVMYVISYIGWFTNYHASDAGRDRCPGGGCEVGVAERAGVWWEEQLELVDYHRRLPTTHPYRSSPATWPVMTRPVLYYFERCTDEQVTSGEPCAVGTGNRAKILGLGNPVLWWTGLLAYPVVAWSALVHRRRPAVVVLAFLAGQYLPWLLVGKDGYFFYATPLVPFIAMSVAWLCARAAASSRLRWVPAGVVGLALVAVVYFLPIWSGVELPRSVLEARMWLHSWR
ncbi:MAG: phospholipid carrier-dependent glycosyltransferase, partial [Actinobacteria bacterium]|nr:phospholipid carrier-dependent glycosyltransferase [Actinomycetota bacterium]